MMSIGFDSDDMIPWKNCGSYKSAEAVKINSFKLIFAGVRLPGAQNGRKAGSGWCADKRRKKFFWGAAKSAAVPYTLIAPHGENPVFQWLSLLLVHTILA
jgi:hypothetical protein